jgi:DNA polymerase
MRIITLDFETRFDQEYSLSKLSTESYCRDSRFQTIGCAIKWQHNIEPRWYPYRELPHIFANEDWSDIGVIAHHANFDGLILNHHYKVRPKMLFCTLSMARLLLGNHLSVALASLAKHFNLSPKNVPYSLFIGKGWDDLSADVQQQVADGACHDVALTWDLFNILLKDFPLEELEVVDITMRMFTDPLLRADTGLLAQIWEREAAQKEARIAALGVTSEDLQSADKFTALLEAEGVEIEFKDGKNGPIPAFAKTDDFMRGLLEDDNDRVRGLAEARLGVKSTLMQTRAETIGWMACRRSGRTDGTLPVYLRYCGSHTTRWSGGDGCLAADTQVLTLDISGIPKYKNIIDVLLTDLVWDGQEFVSHDGVAFRGYQKIVSWDGINGTPEHPVFCGEAVKSLGEALRTKTPLMDCREPTIWEVDVVRTSRARALRQVQMRMRGSKKSSSKRSKSR